MRPFDLKQVLVQLSTRRGDLIDERYRMSSVIALGSGQVELLFTSNDNDEKITFCLKCDLSELVRFLSVAVESQSSQIIRATHWLSDQAHSLVESMEIHSDKLAEQDPEYEFLKREWAPLAFEMGYECPIEVFKDSFRLRIVQFDEGRLDVGFYALYVDKLREAAAKFCACKTFKSARDVIELFMSSNEPNVSVEHLRSVSWWLQEPGDAD
jgi:hypothetical protein